MLKGLVLSIFIESDKMIEKLGENEMEVLVFFREILSNPAIMIATVTCLGLFVQKKPLEYVAKGTIAVIIGYTLVIIASDILRNNVLSDFATLFNYDFNLNGVTPDMKRVQSIGLGQYGMLVSLTVIFGYIANIIMARFSEFKYVFLSGHHAIYMACLLVIIFSNTAMNPQQIVICSSLMLGLLMAFVPFVLEKDMEKLCKKDQIGYGHFSSIGCLVASRIASMFSNNDEDTEYGDIQFKYRLRFMRDPNVCMFIVMSILFLLITGIASTRTNVLTLGIDASGFGGWIMYSFTKAAYFTGCVYIILIGVKMFVKEVGPAFKGLAKVIAPGAKPALDCPSVFSYSPNAMLVGFLMSFVGGLSAMLIFVGINHFSGMDLFPIIIPGLASHFFCGGASGVFANEQGGKKGCIIGSFVQGLFITALSMFVMPLLVNMDISGVTFSDSDFSLVAILFGRIEELISGNVLSILCIVLYLAPIIRYMIHKYHMFEEQ